VLLVKWGLMGYYMTLHQRRGMGSVQNVRQNRAPSSSGNFILHGPYGRVIESGTDFFTNEPPFHPASIDLSQGHPPLTSFLGMPLILDGKTYSIDFRIIAADGVV